MIRTDRKSNFYLNHGFFVAIGRLNLPAKFKAIDAQMSFSEKRQKLISLTLSNGKLYFPYELFESKKDFYENRRYLLRKQVESDEVLLNIKEKELEIIKSRLEEFKKELEAEEHRNVKSCSHRL